MRRHRRAKIVATLGPASGNQAMIEKLFRAGTDVFRINMSHTSHERMRELVAMIRKVEADNERPIGILVDLQGPKLRVGAFEGGSVQLKQGDTFVLDSDATAGNQSRVQPAASGNFCRCRSPATRCCSTTARCASRCRTPGRRNITTRVEVGGKLSDRKGVSLPDSVLPFSALAPKDRSDLEAALDTGIDWVALSFIQRPEDIAEAKKITRGRASVMAKIEKPQAVTRLNDIMEIADALMVARGDLGVEMPLEKVPGVQKQMTRAARWAGKPVVVATQMLELMINSPVPTRAEVSDVATAIFEGADAVMLSAESAAGQYPARSGRHHEPHRRGGGARPDLSLDRQRAARRAGGDRRRRNRRRRATDRRDARSRRPSSPGPRPARPRSASPASGPRPPIIALSPSVNTARKLSLVWGVHSVVTEDAHDLDDMVSRACRISFKEGFAKAGERVIIVCGVPLGTPGATNMLRIAFVGGEDAGIRRAPPKLQRRRRRAR